MDQKQALAIMKMGYNVYLTGEAGTGKTYLLNLYIKYLKKKRIPFAITASTGIAATHLDGITLDSWSGLGIKEKITGDELARLSQKYHLKKKLQTPKVLIIDEISMIHGTRFDAVDSILRFVRNNARPFGGLQVVLSGDLFQLPPVSKFKNYTDYIFKSKAWNALNLHICYLDKPKRQTDPEFLSLLKDIRQNNINQHTKSTLARTFNQTLKTALTPTTLYTHNVDVDALNQKKLAKIPEKSKFYSMSAVGKEKLIWAMKKNCLAPEMLELKKEALVMFVKNDYQKGVVNGTRGKVIGFDKHDCPIVKTAENKKVVVEQASWKITDEKGKIIAQIIQIPLRLAWAITVHKSQGMSLDAVELDLSKSFVEGMGYVALSRVKSLSGLKLLGINEMAFKVNPEVRKMDEKLKLASENEVKMLKKTPWPVRLIKERKFFKKS